MQKYDFQELKNPAKPFDQYEWAFNSEPTDRGILAEQQAALEKGGLTFEKQAFAQYVVNRDSLRKALRTSYTVGQITNAFEQKDENAELLGWFNLFGLDDKSESIEGILASSCGGRSRQEALKYFRENYKPLITDGDAEKEKFEKLDDAGKRKFIENLRKADLSYTVEEGGDYGYSMSPNLGYYGLGKGRIKTKYRTMSDEEYSKWSAEYLNNTKYNRFWNAIYLAGEENAKIALSLSMAQDEDAVKAYIPQLQSLPIEDRAEIYALAREFNPEVSMWRLVKDDFIDSWRDIPRALVNAKDFLHTSASDLKQYVDEHGGLDAIMSDEKAKDEFRNKFFVAEHAVFVGVNRFALPFGGGDEALRDYSEQIYKVGAQMLENRARFDELQQALQTKYASEGEVMDGIIQGISFGIQFGQFVAISAASGGLGTGAEMAGIAAKTGRFANAANKVARLSFAASRKSSALTKLAMPYFGAMMQVDAQNAAREAGLPDEKAFIVGLAIGSANTVLEEIQFAVRQKNPFLGAKIVELMQKRKSFTWEVMKQSAIAGAKRRAGTFAEEYLVENLQNVVQDFGVYLAGTLNETEMREFNEVAEGVLKQSIEMIVPLFTATNIGAGAIPFRALQTFATAERLKGDEKAVHDFNARMQLEEAAAKMSESGIDALTPDVAFKYATAQTEAERSKILYRLGLSSGERAKAKKALEDTKANIEGHAKELFESVKLAIEAKEPLPLLLTDGKNTASTEAMTAVIEEFAKAYGIESEVVLLDSAKGFSEQEMRAIARTYAAANNVSEEEGRRFVLNQMDGMRVGNKIYIIGDKARTPKRALEILKHESGHRGAEEIRAKKGFKSFLDGLLKEYGGEDLVRSAIGAVKGGAYQNLGRYDLAEEFMCMLAEKVKGKNELSKQELSAWQKIKDFFTTVLSGIPKEEGARDMFVANAIRSLWERNYGVDDDGGLDISGEYVSESAKPKETSYSQKRKAKKSFEQKLRELKLKEKKLSDSELELERERLEFERLFDSIPEDDITNRLALIDDADVEVLSDEHLEFAAYNGVEWAGDELVRRENERAQREAERQTDSLLDVMSQNGIKLPTPKAVIEHCKANGLPLSGTLFGEINDLYNSLNFYQKQKYFTGKYVDIDEVANVLRAEHNFPYEGSADFLSDFAENVWGKKETRFSVMPSSKYDQYRKELHRVMKLEQGSMLNASIKVGETPDILKMLGYEDLPLFLSGSVIWKVAFDPAKERFIPEETLGKIGEAIEDPMFIEKSASDSSQPNNSILIHTELEHNGEKLAVVIHLSKEKGGYTIHNIASVYARSQSQKDRVLDESRLLYLNTKKGLSEFNSELSLQSIHPENLKNLFVDGKVFTQDDLSQYKNSKNLKFSFRDTRTSAELEALNAKFRDLYERYKNGDKAAYDEAAKFVAEEGERKGYEVKVYHGTGADGFNVADATSKHQENGEGAQAHGAGLYVAVSKDVAERYRDNANFSKPLYTYFAKGEDLSAGANELGLRLVYFNAAMSDIINKGGFKTLKKNLTKDINRYAREIKELEKRIAHWREKAARSRTQYYNYMSYVISYGSDVKRKAEYKREAESNLKLCETVHDWLEKKGIAEKDIEQRNNRDGGKVFDWVHNMKPNEIIDQDKPISEQPEILEKLKTAWVKDFKPMLEAYYNEKGIVEPNRSNNLKEIESRIMRGKMGDIIYSLGQKKAYEILLKHGIRGFTYDGRQDGRCYVSFEGGATVKLQDPFTFNDNGELIPLTERFDANNPDMRWSIKDSAPTRAEIKEAEKQRADVKAAWTNPDGSMKEGYMKAPNGKKSNLSEAQWLLVRTPNFKRWFGDWENDPKNASKVVDENGEPLVVYHGTRTGGFTVFDNSEGDVLSDAPEYSHFFAARKALANTYSKSNNDNPFYPAIRNIEDLRGLELPYTISEDGKVITQDGKSTSWTSENLDEAGLQSRLEEFKKLYPESEFAIEKTYSIEDGMYFSGTEKEAVEWFNNEGGAAELYRDNEADGGIYSTFLNIRDVYEVDFKGANWDESPDGTTNDVVRQARDMGFDGVIIRNVIDSGGEGREIYDESDVYVAFDPTQIKSTDNVGTYSENPDIRWSFVEAKSAPKDMPADVNSPTLVEDMKQWALNYYKGKTVQMPDDKGILRTVSIDKRGIKEAMNHLRKRVNEDRKRLFVKTMPLIEELLEKADFKSKPQNKHEGQKLDIYKYEVGFNDEGKNYLVDITIKENLQGKFYYDHNLTKIKTLGVQKNSDVKTSTSSVYDIPSQNSAESQGENSENAKFSAADSDLEKRKRAAAVRLAEQIYRQAGQDFNPEDGSASPMKATEEQIRDVYMSEMDFLDDDVDDVVNQAEAIAYRMASRGVSLKDMREEARRIEDEFNTSKIVEACIKDAQKKWEKDLRAAEKMRRQEKRDFEAQKRGITAWDADELAMENINLLDAITGDADAKEEIRKLLEKCKKWADAEGVSYDLMLEKFKATLAANFEGIASQFVRYRHIKSALESIAKILESETEEQAASRAEKLSQKLAEYLQRELSAFEEKEAKKAEKKAEREKREKEKKAAKKLKEAHARAVRMLLKFARSQKLPPHSQLEIKRKLPARIQAYLAQIKKVMPLSAEEVKSRFQFLSEKKGKLEVDGEDLNYKERYEMSALQFFGNIKEKSLPELLEIKAKLKELIEGQMDAQAQRLEEMEAEVAKTAEPLAQSLNLSPNAENADESGIYNTVKLGAKGVSMLEHRLRNIFLARKGLTEEQKKILEGWIADYAMRMSRASIEERRFKNAEMDWLRNTIRQIYGRKFTDKIGNPIEAQVFERLTKPSASLAKFADADAGGRVLSLGQMMQIFVSLEQWEVREAWAQAQERMLRLKADNAKIPEKFKAQYEYWERLFGAKAEMETFLSEEDKELIRALKRRYRERLDTINPVYERYNGLPMISSGLNYMPLVRDGELNIEAGGESNAIHLFPSYYAPRQISLKKLDEGANILQVFQSRTNTDAHFVNFAELIFQTKELWGNKALGGALKTRVPHKELNSLLAALRDPLKGEISRQKTVNADIANAISNWTAYFGLGFNLTSAGKQPMSFPAFMLKVPAKEWFGGFFEAVLHPMQFISDMREVWKSEYLQDRRKAGEINQVLADIEREAKSLKDEISAKKALRRLITKYSFAPIKFADSLAFVIGGTVVYKNFYKRYVETHAPEEASRLAMLDMLSVGEMTQQSAFIMNMSEGQRRDGGFGRMFSLFRTTNQQYMSFEVNAWNEFYARRDAASFKRFVKTLLLNHVILPGLFNGMGLLENLLLGDDMDDDDWDIFLQNLAICAFLDVFTGWWFSSVLKGAAQAIVFGGQNKITETMLPANAISRLSSVAFMAVKEIQKNGFADADWLKLLDSLGKATTPIYRTGRKLYENITDGEEGVLW